MAKRVEDRHLASDALVALRRRPLRFTLPDGATAQFPKTAVDGLIEILEAIAEGDAATVVRISGGVHPAGRDGAERVAPDGGEAH